MFKKIYTHLKNNNIDCYSIGQHEGKCVKPYVVIKDMGKAKTALDNLDNICKIHA